MALTSSQRLITRHEAEDTMRADFGDSGSDDGILQFSQQQRIDVPLTPGVPSTLAWLG